MRFHFSAKSSNTKTGPIPVTTTESKSCPPSCPLQGSGCYAELGPMGWFWQRVDNGSLSIGLSDLIARIRQLPSGQLWRHNQAYVQAWVYVPYEVQKGRLILKEEGSEA